MVAEGAISSPPCFKDAYQQPQGISRHPDFLLLQLKKAFLKSPPLGARKCQILDSFFNSLFLDSKLLYAWQGASLTWSIIKEAIMLGLQLDNCESISAINSHESHEFQIKSE